MKTILYSKISKEEVETMPIVEFGGRIIVVADEKLAEKAVDFLLDQPILGLDTETKPVFRKGGGAHKVALLQVATHKICFLFRLNLIDLCAPVKRLLEDEIVPKVGVSLHDDIASLSKRAAFTPGNFIDMQIRAREIGITDVSLQKLYAIFFGQKISKRQRLSNWEAPELSEKQKIYAATDAWTCINLYERLMWLKETDGFEVLDVDLEEQEESESHDEI